MKASSNGSLIGHRAPLKEAVERAKEPAQAAIHNLRKTSPRAYRVPEEALPP